MEIRKKLQTRIENAKWGAILKTFRSSRRPPLFHPFFWILFHAILLTVNILFSALHFPPDRLSFWLALVNASAVVVFLGFSLLLIWNLGIGRFFHSTRVETLFYAFLGFLATLYISDIFYFRVMGTGLGLFFKYLWRLPLADIRDLIIATQISKFNLLLLAVFLLLLPAILWWIARGTMYLSKRRPFYLPSGVLLAMTILSFATTAACQWIVQRQGDTYHWGLYAKALPVYLPILETGGQTVTMAVRVRPYERLDQKAADLPIAAGHLPQDLPVFVVISETVRQDFVIPELMPNLHAFQNNNISFRHSFCSGNSTHYSWFSILYGAHPIYWNAQRSGEDQLGSPALQVLKKAGFKIHLYSKPHHLRYLGFGELIFGKDHRLVDEAVIAPALSTCGADQYSVDKLKERIRQGLPPGRHLYLLFLDSTHHNYTFPEDFPTPFRPFVDDFSYLKLDYSADDVDKIRNRYKNALHYVDSLFGQVLQALNETGVYPKSLIGFVADHGEEFMEHGALIHGSNLFDPQMRVPICFKKPGGGRRQMDRIVAGIDFFPTLLDFLDLYGQSKPVLQGTSALDLDRPNSALLANNHAAEDPYDFALFNGNYKLRFRLDENDARQSSKVTFTGACDRRDQPVSFAGKNAEPLALFIQRQFSKELRGISFLTFRDPP